jgi:TusE/DsrC/DsvC family sulfur relay protein
VTHRDDADRVVVVDADGYLTDPLAWTPDVAEAIAREMDLAPLTPAHWKVIASCREAAARDRRPPRLAHLAGLAGMDTARLRALFGRTPEASAFRIAGLGNPALAGDGRDGA